jgi:hypothetical protein
MTLGKHFNTMSKYYTPEIEEFHVGFRCEEKQDSLYAERRKWIVREIKYPHDIQRVSVALKQPLMDGKHVRVKYLDRADIEELGWEHIPNPKDMITTGGIPEKYEMIKEVRRREIEYMLDRGGALKGPYNTHIYKSGRRIFDGHIKNYNELKKLMKQLGI